MSLISVRLPDDLEAKLAREAERSQRPKSEVAREAIVEYLARQERERFLGAISRAARAPGWNPVAIAEEALPLDNEALEVSETPAAQEPRLRYRPGRKKR